MDVSIIVINYNTFDLTLQCVSSVLRFTKKVTFEVIVVDNASSFFDEGGFRTSFPEVKLILSKENLGFAKGNNLGIQHASGKYVLLLNSDAYLKNDAVSELVNYLDKHPKAAVVSPKLIYPDGRHQSVCQRFPSVRYQLAEVLRLQKALPEKAGGKLLLGSFFDHTRNAKADWVWGACFMFRRALLEQLPAKKLDDSFFMYCEDMQWCWDFKKLGYEVHYLAGVEIVHLMGGSSGNKNGYMDQNMKQFLSKNYTSLHQKMILFLNGLLTSYSIFIVC